MAFAMGGKKPDGIAVLMYNDCPWLIYRTILFKALSQNIQKNPKNSKCVLTHEKTCENLSSVGCFTSINSPFLQMIRNFLLGRPQTSMISLLVVFPRGNLLSRDCRSLSICQMGKTATSYFR